MSNTMKEDFASRALIQTANNVLLRVQNVSFAKKITTTTSESAERSAKVEGLWIIMELQSRLD